MPNLEVAEYDWRVESRIPSLKQGLRGRKRAVCCKLHTCGVWWVKVTVGFCESQSTRGDISALGLAGMGLCPIFIALKSRAHTYYSFIYFVCVLSSFSLHLSSCWPCPIYHCPHSHCHHIHNINNNNKKYNFHIIIYIYICH